MKRHFMIDPYTRIRFDHIDATKGYLEFRGDDGKEYKSIIILTRGGHQYIIQSQHADRFLKEYEAYLDALSYLPSD